MDNGRGGRQATADKRGIEVMKQKLLTSMSEDMKAVPKLLKESAGESSCCIFRVPQALAGGKVEAYWPRIISIGPYHRGETHLQMLQEHKWRYLRAMLDRIQPHGVGLEDLIDAVAPKEKMIRQCYSESTVNFSGPDLVKMMILDGCFIIELLRQIGGLVSPDPQEPLLKNSSVLNPIGLDFLRLENQVPYFVLEDFFETTKVTKEVTWGLADLALRFFSHILFVGSIHRSNRKGVHLLDLIRLSLIPWDQRDINPAVESSFHQLIGSASKLYRDGIRFKKSPDRSFLKIKFNFEEQTIEIPELKMDDTLNCILLNMVAFEQWCGHCDKQVTAYAMFMGCLVQTAEDAQLLHDGEVIRNLGMSKDDVARFFGNVYKDAYCDIGRSYLASTLEGVSNYLTYRPGVWMGRLVYEYFDNNPWASFTAIVGFVSCTGLIQTVYAVLQYYQHK